MDFGWGSQVGAERAIADATDVNRIAGCRRNMHAGNEVPSHKIISERHSYIECSSRVDRKTCVGHATRL